jgi:hypothetical protein
MKLIIKTLMISLLFGAIEGVSFSKTFAELKAKIQNMERQFPGQTYTIAQLLSELPLEQRSNFTLIKQSESLQEASLFFPRVIMFGKDASLILTFNGNNQQKGYERIELVEVNPITAALEFREMIFPTDDSGIGKVKFSEINPPKCMTCHGPTPHYIWTSYDQWPAAFGSNDDIVDLNSEEKKNLLLFKNQMPSHPRYKTLEFYQMNENPASPFRPLTLGRQGENRGDYKIAIEFRPNFRLGSLISRRQANARVSEWKSLPSFESQKYKLASQLAGCIGSSEEKLSKILLAMGREYQNDFSFNIGAKVDGNFSPAVVTFENSVQYFLWSNLIGSAPKLKDLFIPYNFSEVARVSKTLMLAESEYGHLQWQALDSIAPVLGNFSGAWEADYLARETNLMSIDPNYKSKICQALVQFID